MKTNKFKKHLELLGLRLAPLRSKRFAVQTVIGSRNIAYISEKTQYVFSTDTEYFHNNAFDNQETLYLLLKEYAETPLEEREEEKKYRYKIKHHINNNEPTILHVIRLNDTTIELDGSSERHAKLSATFHFTDKEVEKYTGKDGALFNTCEKIEVTP